MVGLFRPRAHSTPGLLPLLPDDVPTLRRPLVTAFTTRALREHLVIYPGLAWRTADGAEYVIGGQWRRRGDIGTIEELAARRHAAALLGRLLAAHGAAGARLVVLGLHEAEMREDFYLGQGFQQIDRIVRMEKLAAIVPGELPPSAAHLRAYDEADCAAVLEVERHSFDWLWWNSAAEFSAYARQPGVRVVVAELEGRVVGYSGSTLHQRDGHLDRLAVHRAVQGQGIGRLLLVEALRRISAAGVRWVGLTTQMANHHAQALYRRYGFARAPLEMTIIGHWLGPKD